MVRQLRCPLRRVGFAAAPTRQALVVNHSPVSDMSQLINLHFSEDRVRNADSQFTQHTPEIINFLQVCAGVIVAEVGIEDVLSFVCTLAVLDDRTENIVQGAVVAQRHCDLFTVLGSSGVFVLRHGFLVGATIRPNDRSVHLLLFWVKGRGFTAITAPVAITPTGAVRLARCQS